MYIFKILRTGSVKRAISLGTSEFLTYQCPPFISLFIMSSKNILSICGSKGRYIGYLLIFRLHQCYSDHRGKITIAFSLHCEFLFKSGFR